MRGSGLQKTWRFGPVVLWLGWGCGGPFPRPGADGVENAQEVHACGETKDCTVTYREEGGCCLTCLARASSSALETEAEIACAPQRATCGVQACADNRTRVADCLEGVCVVRPAGR